MDDPSESQSSEELDALNRHGVFLKKRVAEEIHDIEGLEVFAEEFGVSFDTSTAIDLIVCEEPRLYAGQPAKRLWFVLECKRAYARQKRWVFFSDLHTQFRQYRQSEAGVESSVSKSILLDSASNWSDELVCSEGYELKPVRDKKLEASPDPIFAAGNQLSRGYLGFISRFIEDQKHRTGIQPSRPVEIVVPVLVTTASLFIASYETDKISLVSGNLDHGLNLKPVDWLVLKHPFSVPDINTTRDFRYSSVVQGHTYAWVQQFRESIFVVRAESLKSFFSVRMREWFLDR